MASSFITKIIDDGNHKAKSQRKHSITQQQYKRRTHISKG